MNIKSVVAFSLGPIGAAFVGLITAPILSWILDVEVIGIYSISVSAVSLSIISLSMGMDSSYIREFHEVGNKARLFSTCLTTMLIFAFLFSFLFLAFAYDDFNYFGLSKNELHYLCFISILATVNRFFSLRLRMQERAAFYSGYLVLNKVFILLLLISLYCVSFPQRESVFLSLLLTHIFLFLYLLLFSKDGFSLNKPDMAQVPSLLKYGFPLAISSMSYWAMASSDKFIISHYLGMSSVGVYSIAQTIGAVFIILQSILSVIWPPYIYKLNKISKSVAILEGYKWIDIITSISVLICLVFISSIELIIKIFPEEYFPIVDIVGVIFLSSVVYTISELILIGINISKKTFLVMGITGISLMLNIMLSIVLVSDLQLYGIALATLISFSVMLLLRLLFSHALWGSDKKFSILTKLVLIYAMVIFHGDIPDYLFLFLTLLMFFLERKKITGLIGYVKKTAC